MQRDLSRNAAYLTLTRRDWLLGLLIVLLAFALRMVIIVDRAHAPNDASAFDPLPPGSDQKTYYEFLQAYHEGEYPPDTFFYQPGITYYLIAASHLVQTTNLGALRVFNVALAALNCGLLIATTQLVFGWRSVSLLAGLLLAVYPVAAFYDTDFVITSQTMILLSLALFGIMWLWRSRPTALNIATGAALYGLSFGALAVTRFEPIFLAPVFGLWLIAVKRTRAVVLAVALAAVLALLVLLPVVLHNRAGGADYLITPVGQAEIYRGHSRDATGINTPTRASLTTSDDYLTYLAHDTRLEPRRFAEVLLRQAGLFLSNHEPGNNLNYNLSGEAVSPLLRGIPLNFQILLALALFGACTMLSGPSLAPHHRAATMFFAAAFLTLMGAIMLIWVEARLRTSVILFMIPPAAYGVVVAFERIPAALARPWPLDGVRRRAVLLRWIAPWIVIVPLLLAAQWTADNLPRPLTVDALPADGTPAGYVYDDTLKLVGWQVQDAYSRPGVLQPFRPYVVSLYWEVLQPTATDYSFSLGYFVDGERLTGWDDRIGFVTYPKYPTSKWEPGTIYVEHVGIDYRRFDGPRFVSGELLLTVYPEREPTYLKQAVGAPGNPTHIELARPALAWGDGRLTANLQQTRIAFGDVLMLRGWDFPTSAAPGSEWTIDLGWQTTDEPITRSYSISVHLQAEDGRFVVQHDSPPQGGRLLTTSLPTTFSFQDSKQLTLPDTSGTYTIYVVVYDSNTKERLAVDATDNMLPLDTLQITPGATDDGAAGGADSGGVDAESPEEDAQP